MVQRMRSLEGFLRLAISQGAEQLVLQTGQPPLLGDGHRDEPVGEPIADEELSEALRAVLSDEQQIELAVGNVVEFHLEMDGQLWSFVTDPRVDGIVVRGRRAGARSGDAGVAPDSGDLLAGIEVPMVHVELPDDDSAPPVSSGSRWAKFEVPVDTAEIDLGEEPGEDSGEGGASPQWPSELGGDLPPPAAASAEVEHTPGAAAPPAGGLADSGVTREGAGTGGHGGDPDGQHPGPVEVGSTAPTLKDVEAATPPSPFAPDGTVGPTEEGAPVTTFGADPQPWEDQLRQHAEFIEPGTLVFLRARGVGETVADALGLPCHVIDSAGGTRAWRAVLDEDRDGYVVVLREPDPSRHLARVLRSLEEGARVAVETRARTLEGARRILLGLDASERAERWLDAHPQRWLELAPDGWRVR